MRIKHLIQIVTLICLLSCKNDKQEAYSSIEVLRQVYSSSDLTTWPEPNLDSIIDKSTLEDIEVQPDLPYP